jgi:hypothetical protein
VSGRRGNPQLRRSRSKPPDPENEIAAPTDIGNGDKSGQLASYSEDGNYSTERLAARFLIIARHFGFEVQP